MNLNNLRSSIRGMLLENIEKMEEDFHSFLQTVDFSGKGYNLQNVTEERYYGTGTDYEKLKHFTITLQHVKPDFKKFVEERANQPGKTGTVYGDTPTSKTKIIRWITGYKEGSEIDARQKSAAIKIVQLAGLDAIQKLIIDPFESKHPGAVVVANFTGAKTKNKGLSFFEVYVFPPTVGSQTDAPVPPTEIPVDGEVVEIPREPAAKPAKKPKKPRKKRKVKMPKLTSKQRKAGYNQINQQGHVRHILEPDELQDISDHIAELVLGSGAKEQDELGPGDAADAYQRCRERSEYSHKHGGMHMYRIVDDYYDNPLPRLVFYKCQIFDGGRIKSRSMMSQYTSRGSNRKEGFHADEHGEYTRGMGVDPNYGRSFADEDFGDYTPPKLGGKEAKDTRRYVNAKKANDELIIYALVSPKINKYTSKPSIHTGTVKLYVFQLDRNFPEES